MLPNPNNGNQIASSPNPFQREAFKVKTYICSKIYICQYWSHQKLGQVRGRTKIFHRTVPHSVTQTEFNDLVQDLNLPKTKARLLGSRFQQWNLTEKGVKASFYRKRQLNTAKYFLMDGDMVCCNDVCGLMEELKL
jgi:hypothetical protein